MGTWAFCRVDSLVGDLQSLGAKAPQIGISTSIIVNRLILGNALPGHINPATPLLPQVLLCRVHAQGRDQPFFFSVSQRVMGPRAPSLESDRRHLTAPSVAPSVATSRATSIKSVKFADESSKETREIGPAPHDPQANPSSNPNIPQPYRGYPSREAYLAAFLEFAREKQYYEPDQQLIGFYGTKTMEDRLKEATGHRSKSKADRKADKARRKSAQSSKMPAIHEDSGELRVDTGPTARWNLLFKNLTRRASVA
jgi:hypothetical protein